jgi:hypothetical protein
MQPLYIRQHDSWRYILFQGKLSLLIIQESYFFGPYIDNLQMLCSELSFRLLSNLQPYDWLFQSYLIPLYYLAYDHDLIHAPYGH